jgi:hypothetical protein
MLASPNRRAEDICIHSVIISELKLRDVERHIFGADFVERADHARLKIDREPSIVFV